MVFAFLLALFAALFSRLFFASLPLLAFAPYLALSYMKKDLLSSLFLALLAGVTVDLITSELRFGMNSFAYAITTLILYRQKRNFFLDKPLSLFLFTLFISSLIALILLLMQAIPLTPSNLLSSLVLMPLIDALYAFLWFTCPLQLYHYGRKRKKRGA